MWGEWADVDWRCSRRRPALRRHQLGAWKWTSPGTPVRQMPLRPSTLRKPLATGLRQLGMPRTRHNHNRSKSPAASHKSTSMTKIKRAGRLPSSPMSTMSPNPRSAPAVSLFRPLFPASPPIQAPSLLLPIRTSAPAVLRDHRPGHRLDYGPDVDLPPRVSRNKTHPMPERHLLTPTPKCQGTGALFRTLPN